MEAVRSRPIDLGEALRRYRDPLTDGRDRALATDLVTGTLRWRGAIDFQIQRAASKPLARLDPGVLDVLRLAVYQLLYLTRVPAAAIVGESVELVRAAGFRSAAGFANAVLRKIAASRTAPVWPERPGPAVASADRQALVAYLAIVHSHPEWLVERWITRYGAEGAEVWLEFNNQKPAVTLAANRLRIDRVELGRRLQADGIETQPTRVAPQGLTVTRGRVAGSAALREGLCLVQDEASQIVPELVQASARSRVLRRLRLAWRQNAGPGRASHRWPRRGDRRARKAHRDSVRDDSSHAGRARAHPACLGGRCVAVPRLLCSIACWSMRRARDLGTVRRDPDIKWRRTPDDLPAFAAEQVRLLRRVAPLVAVGGRLIYSTCSSEPEENEEVVAAFLA